jgi:diguanylate cyclase (GGDEF)-like protein
MGKLKYKLVRILLLISALPLIIVASITVIFIQSIAISDAEQKLNNNLNIAQSIYQDVNENLRKIAREQNIRIHPLLENNQPDLLRLELEKVCQDNVLDFFVVVDNQSKIIASVSNPEARGEDSSNDYAIQKVLLEGQSFVSTEILTAQEIEKLGLTQRAAIPGIKNTQGMVIRAVGPIVNLKHEIVGAMSLGYLLNNNNKIIIDEIKRKTGLLSSILMGDLRIASNIPSKKDEHAVGRRLNSAEIKNNLLQGKRYITSILVLNDWYKAGYIPIYNYAKEVVGSLGIGISEATIYALRNKLIFIFSLAVFISIFLALIFGLLRGRDIVRSIEKLRYGTEVIAGGDFEHEINIDSGDEIEELANFFNKMVLQLKAARERITSLAITDNLTGLFNHRYFHEQMYLEIMRALRYKHPLSLIMFDIDSFKTYNDRFGHLEGDRILKEVAALIKKNVRRIDIVSRYGGEEFMVILSDTEVKHARFVAEKIRKLVQEKMTLFDKETNEVVKVTISGGVAGYKKGQSKDGLISHVDRALYKAKAEGKNKVCVYE